MKTSRVLINGSIIFIGIALFFIFMETLNLSDKVYLRLLNFVFVIYGVNLTIKQNYKDEIYGYLTNLLSGFTTAFVSLVLGIASFIAYAEYMGGESYIDNHANSYLFGGDPSIYQFSMMLFIEGLAASAIVSFTLMQSWKNKVETIDEVDDMAHNPH